LPAVSGASARASRDLFTGPLMRRRDAPTASARDRASARAFVALSSTLCATLALAFASVGVCRGAELGSIPVSVSVDRTHPGAPVPRDFLGLSFELTSLPQIARYADGGDMVTLLRSLGRGVLRFGGVSADTRVAWTDEATARPPWASGVLEAGDLRELGSLAAQSGWHILLTIGLVHYEPDAAAREAAAAKAALGEWLEGLELGNEPNAYAQHGMRAEPWTFVQYDAQVAAYRSAIEAAAPGIALAGPDVSGSGAFESWGLGEVINQRPALLTGHHYPLGCEQVPAPTIARLLSPRIRRLEGSSLRRYMSISQASETPFRLDETNTVSCGGAAGISNTFASALWAVAYLTQAMSMGVAGINAQGNPAHCAGYTPVCAPTPEDLATGALGAQPEWYALLLAKALIGDRPLRTITSSPGRPNVEVATLLAGDGRLHFVIVDDDPPGARRVAVRLRVGSGFRGASILTLTAPSPAALSGVRLGGRAVAPDGSWSEPSRLPKAPNRGGVITVNITPSSAALLTVSPTGKVNGGRVR
jgi:hypothetical protein